MSNSSLVSYTKISPNKNSPRNAKIDTITIHAVVGQLSVEGIGRIFETPTRQASSNYGIGADGRIGMYVEESDRSWCSSSPSNDNRAITIECACEPFAPYAISNTVYSSLIKLIVDICNRNEGIPNIKWLGDKNLIGHVDKQNMTVHRWFANKDCPGSYIYNRLGTITEEVNAQLKTGSSDSSDELYRVQTGSFKDRRNADKEMSRMTALGFKPYVFEEGSVYSVQLGAYKNKANADKVAYDARTKGVEVYIKSKTSKKSIEEIAREVIKGSWGVGNDRVDRLTRAGYDYKEVQKKVNSLLS